MRGGVEEALECCGSGGDVGYSCTEPNLLYSGTIETTTTQDLVKYGEVPYVFTEMPPETMTIVFDDEEFAVQRVIDGNNLYYGSNPNTAPLGWYYPFSFVLLPDRSILAVNSDASDNHTLELYDGVSSVETSECFEKAVNSLSPLFRVKDGMDVNEVLNAYNSGEKLLYVFGASDYDSGYYFLTYYDEFYSKFVLTPQASNMSIEVEDDKIKIITRIS